MLAYSLKAFVRSLWLPMHSLKLPVCSLWLLMRSLWTPVCSLTLLERRLWIPLYSLLPFSCSLRIYLPKTLMTFDNFKRIFESYIVSLEISWSSLLVQRFPHILHLFQLVDNRVHRAKVSNPLLKLILYLPCYSNQGILLMNQQVLLLTLQDLSIYLQGRRNHI